MIDEHKEQFYFLSSLIDYGQVLSEDFTNLVLLLTLDHNSNTSSVSVDNSGLETSGESNNVTGELIESGSSEEVNLEHSEMTNNSCNKDNITNRYIGKFVSEMSLICHQEIYQKLKYLFFQRA